MPTTDEIHEQDMEDPEYQREHERTQQENEAEIAELRQRRRESLDRMVRIGEESGLYEATANTRVCVTHGRVSICRYEDGCVWSEERADVDRVMAWQRGEQ